MATRLLLINPNTTRAITDRVVAAASAYAPGVECVGATGRFGARYVSSRATYAIASHAALDAWANAEGPFDAVVLACFGDPGLDALRELSPVPVIGMADASLHIAMQAARRFSIVTGGDRWKSMLRDFTRSRGVDGCIASIRTVTPTGAALGAAPEAALALLRDVCTQCVDEDGAEAVVVGGAGLVNLTGQVRAQLAVPIIDGLEAAVTMAVGMTAMGPLAKKEEPFISDRGVECVGLSEKLTVALA